MREVAKNNPKRSYPLCLKTSAYHKKLPHSFPFLIVAFRKIGYFIKEKGNTKCKNQAEVRAGQKLLQHHRRTDSTPFISEEILVCLGLV